MPKILFFWLIQFQH